MTNKECKNCEHIVYDEEDESIRCSRFPPQMVLTKPMGVFFKRGSVMHCFPRTREDYFCGEFKEKAEVEEGK